MKNLIVVFFLFSFLFLRLQEKFKWMVNKTTAGTYEFETNPGSRQNSFCGYITGKPYAPTDYYSTQSGNSPGTITIESLTPGFIKGTFTANCKSANGALQITNGSFKGDF